MTPNGQAVELEEPDGKHGAVQVNLLEQILSRENMLRAWKRVKANKGAAGMDGMSIDAFPEFVRQHWERIRSALEKGTYRPAAVRRVMIAKATGGQRPLGIPTVLDRVIQQAIAQVIASLYEPQFNTHSYGFRPGRSARMALAEMEEAYRDGLRFAVDCDLKSFFDTVDHGLLMNRLAQRIKDRRVLRCIGRYLRAGVILPDGTRERTRCGVPQGGPLSPLLANVMLDDLDSEMERRSLRFTRYADDFLIFVRTQAAADRVLGSVARFVNAHLRLRVNEAKSKAAPIHQCSFLGFELRRGRLRWTSSVVKRFKERVRQITARSSGRSIYAIVADLRLYVRGWVNYFGPSRSYNELMGLDQWLRRRVRLCYWKQWKRPRTRRRHLLALGISRDDVKLASRSRKGYWRMSGNSIVQRALTKEWL
jgi:RNA-directed DNA polymerase